MSASSMTKRFFHLDDNGVTYVFVARDLNHAKELLRASNTVLIADNERGEPGVDEAEWSELTLERAQNYDIAPNDHRDYMPDPDPARAEVGYMIPKSLAHYELGDWFSSEY